MKNLLTYILIFILSLSAVGCGSTKKGNVVKNKSELEGTIVVWSSGNAAKALKEAGEKFTKQYPKVTVDVRELKGDSSYDNISGTLSSGVDMPDIFTIGGDKVQAIASKFSNKLLDLSDEMSSSKGKYLKSKQLELSVNKKIYAYPWTSEPVAVFYREDVFKAAAVNVEDIKTWEQYITAGKNIAAYNKTDTKVLAVNDIEWLNRVLLCQLGSGYFDNSNKPVLNSEDFIKAASMTKTLKNFNLIYRYSDLDSLISGIKSGNIVALPMNVQFGKILREQCSELNGKWAVMELPAFEFGGKTAASSGGLDIMVTTAAKNKNAAQEFTRYITSNTNVLSDMFIRYGLFSCYTPFLNDVLFENKVGYFNSGKTWNIFNKVSKEVKEINYTPDFIETQQSVKEALDKIVEKNEDIKTTLDELQKNIESK